MFIVHEKYYILDYPPIPSPHIIYYTYNMIITCHLLTFPLSLQKLCGSGQRSFLVQNIVALLQSKMTQNVTNKKNCFAFWIIQYFCLFFFLVYFISYYNNSLCHYNYILLLVFIYFYIQIHFLFFSFCFVYNFLISFIYNIFFNLIYLIFLFDFYLVFPSSIIYCPLNLI